MLGLIQKDIYQMLKYQRVLLLIVIVFAAVSAKNIDNAFFSIYPAVIAGLSMVTLQSYDEQSGFACYSMVMPVSKKTIVGEKYLYGIGDDPAGVAGRRRLLPVLSVSYIGGPSEHLLYHSGGTHLPQRISSLYLCLWGRTGTYCLCGRHGCVLRSDISDKGSATECSHNHAGRCGRNWSRADGGFLCGIRSGIR